MNRFVWPLVGFAILVVLLAVGLNLNPREVPSPLIGKPAPDFTLPKLGSEESPGKTETFSPQQMKGKVWLLNVWSTWCVSCRQEHPMLVEMAKNKAVTLIGFNYKEIRGDAGYDIAKIDPQSEKAMASERANAWLRRHGDPYALSVLDLDGRVGIDYGVYGVPETYIIDKAGIIRFKHIGPITPEIFSGKILSLVGALNK